MTVGYENHEIRDSFATNSSFANPSFAMSINMIHPAYEANLMLGRFLRSRTWEAKFCKTVL